MAAVARGGWRRARRPFLQNDREGEVEWGEEGETDVGGLGFRCRGLGIGLISSGAQVDARRVCSTGHGAGG